MDEDAFQSTSAAINYYNLQPSQASPETPSRSRYNNSSPLAYPSFVNAEAFSMYSPYGHGQHQPQHARVNSNGSGPPARNQQMYNYQYQTNHHTQQMAQQAQAQAQAYAQAQGQSHAHAPGYGHTMHYQESPFQQYSHSGLPSSGVMSHATPNFSPALEHTHMAQATNDKHHSTWQEQMKLYAEAVRMNNDTQNHQITNHWARYKGRKAIDEPEPMLEIEDEYEVIDRPANPAKLARQDWKGLDFSGHALIALSTAVFNYKFLNEIYLNSNRLSVIPAAIGTLRQLRFLDLSHNKLAAIPKEIGMCVFLETLILFDNEIKTLPYELGSLYKLEMLGIEGNPLDQSMKRDLIEKGTREFILQLRERAPVPVPPPPRQMIDLTGQDPDCTKPRDSNTIKIMTYNILCKRYAWEEYYGYVPSGALAWSYRKVLLLQEIQAADADIVCLQEVDMENYNEYFSMELAHQGYKGVFFPKTRADTMREEKAKEVDGCATYYKRERFVLLDKQRIAFAQLVVNRSDMKGQEDVHNRLGIRDNIAAICFFENRATGARFIVVNAHTVADPNYADVKTIQTAIMMEYVTKQAEKYARWPPSTSNGRKQYTLSEDDTESPDMTPKLDTDGQEESVPSVIYSSNTSIPLFIVGDFNSTCGSAVHDLFSSGSVPATHPEIAGRSYGNFTSQGIFHPFSLKSAYEDLIGTPQELKWTNYTPVFTGVLDYIWCGSNTWEVERVLGPVDERWMRGCAGFPDWRWPSDHLSLVAEFRLKGVRKRVVNPRGGRQRGVDVGVRACVFRDL